MKYNPYDIPPEDGTVIITRHGAVLMSIETLRTIIDNDNEKNAQLLETIEKGLRKLHSRKGEEQDE